VPIRGIASSSASAMMIVTMMILVMSKSQYGLFKSAHKKLSISEIFSFLHYSVADFYYWTRRGQSRVFGGRTDPDGNVVMLRRRG
jgi:predicted ferric reductase